MDGGADEGERMRRGMKCLHTACAKCYHATSGTSIYRVQGNI